jgi:hypothetical protein
VRENKVGAIAIKPLALLVGKASNNSTVCTIPSMAEPKSGVERSLP